MNKEVDRKMGKQLITVNPLSGLKNEQLSSVIFVQDYLQLDFDGQRLTCYIWPQIFVAEDKYEFGESEYRNKLCGLISKVIKEVTVKDSISLEFVFADNSKIFLPLDYEDKKVKEIATFKDSDGDWSFF